MKEIIFLLILILAIDVVRLGLSLYSRIKSHKKEKESKFLK